MTAPRWTLSGAPLMSDAELIERVLAGDREFFQAIVQRYQDTLFRVAYSMVFDEDAAADIVQDAFVRAYANLARCNDRRRFRVWLLATLRNRALDYLKEKRRKDVSLSDIEVVRRAERGALTEPGAADRYELRLELETALARLSEPLREAFVLRHIEQCSYEEIAELLGTGVSAAKMRVQRARTQLQDWLDSDVTGRPARSS